MFIDPKLTEPCDSSAFFDRFAYVAGEQRVSHCERVQNSLIDACSSFAEVSIVPTQRVNLVQPGLPLRLRVRDRFDVAAAGPFDAEVGSSLGCDMVGNGRFESR